MTTSVVGSRYAAALSDVVTQPGSTLQPADAVAQVKTIESWIAGSPDLQSILLTPAVTNARKRAVLGKLTQEAGISPVIRNFLYVIVDHRRIAQLSEIRAAFEELLDRNLGYVRAQVSSAFPLDVAQRQSIEAELMRISGKKIRMQTTVDKDLLGGVVARIGSTVYDGSVRGQLENMRRVLTEGSADYKVEI